MVRGARHVLRPDLHGALSLDDATVRFTAQGVRGEGVDSFDVVSADRARAGATVDLCGVGLPASSEPVRKAHRYLDIELISGRQWPEAIEQLLRGLPEWFGIEQSLLDYVEHSRTLPTTAALDGDEVVGACVVRHHFPRSAEIELLAVRRDRHRQGIGRRLVETSPARSAPKGSRCSR